MPAKSKSRVSTGSLVQKRTTPPARHPTHKHGNSAVFPIVGIGASAGGLEATMQLLQSLPPTPGLAFVLVQHLDPTHESALSSLLSRTTAMPVTEAKHNLRLEPNRVYVIPPNKVIDIADGRLKVSPRKTTKDVHMPIDHFLESLAEEEGPRAIGVILSGNGSDGTRGLRAIKAAGGITFTQDEKSAKYPSMPASASAAGCVDFVLTPNRIAQELVGIAGHPYVVPSKAEEVERMALREQKQYQEIFTILRQAWAWTLRNTSGPRWCGASSGGWPCTRSSTSTNT